MRNADINIKALENGYLVDLQWYPLEGEYTKYMDKKYTFKTWDEVTDWVKNNQLEMPPVQ